MNWVILLPPDLAPVLGAALVALSFVTSFITAAFGIGGGLLMLAVLATILPPPALIPVHGFVQLGSNVSRASLLTRFIHGQALLRFGLGTAMGAALGGVIAVDLPPGLVQMGVGGFVLWSVFSSPPRWLVGLPVLTGGIAAFLAMFFGATGPFLINFVRAMNLERQAHVGTHAAMMVLQHLLKVVVFGLLGFAFGPWLPLIGGMIAAGFLGTFVGKRVLMRMSDGVFRRVLTVLLVLVSLRLIVSGLMML